MKTITGTCLGIAMFVCTLLQLTTAQYPLNANNARIIGLFNPFHGKIPHSEFYNLQNQINMQGTSIAVLNSKVATLQTQVQALQASNAVILAQLPICPSTAPAGSKVIGAYCYSYSASFVDYQTAKMSCRMAGGKLPEPIPVGSTPSTASLSLMTVLINKFPAIGSNDLWIGVEVPANTPASSNTAVHYATTNQIVQFFSVVTLASTNVIQGVYIRNPSGLWTFAPFSSNTIKSYVCQYDTVFP